MTVTIVLTERNIQRKDVMPTLTELCDLVHHEVDVGHADVENLEARLAVLQDLASSARPEEAHKVVELFDHLYVSVCGRCLEVVAKSALFILDLELKRFQAEKVNSPRPLWMEFARRTLARRSTFEARFIRPLHIRAKSLAQYEVYARDGAILNALKDLHFRVERASTPASRQFLISNTGR